MRLEVLPCYECLLVSSPNQENKFFSKGKNFLNFGKFDDVILFSLRKK